MERAQQTATDTVLALAYALGECVSAAAQMPNSPRCTPRVAAFEGAARRLGVLARPLGHRRAWHLVSFAKPQEALQRLEFAQALAAQHRLHGLAATAALQPGATDRMAARSRQSPGAGRAGRLERRPGSTPLWWADHADIQCRVALQSLDFHAAVGHARRAAGHLQTAGVCGLSGDLPSQRSLRTTGRGRGRRRNALASTRWNETSLPRYLAARLRCLADLTALAAADQRGDWNATRQATLIATLRSLRAGVAQRAALAARPHCAAVRARSGQRRRARLGACGDSHTQIAGAARRARGVAMERAGAHPRLLRGHHRIRRTRDSRLALWRREQAAAVATRPCWRRPRPRCDAGRGGRDTAPPRRRPCEGRQRPSTSRRRALAAPARQRHRSEYQSTTACGWTRPGVWVDAQCAERATARMRKCRGGGQPGRNAASFRGRAGLGTAGPCARAWPEPWAVAARDACAHGSRRHCLRAATMARRTRHRSGLARWDPASDVRADPQIERYAAGPRRT